MRNTLLVDAGATKTDWSFLSDDSSQIIRYKSLGINPAHDSTEKIHSHFQDIKKIYKDFTIEKIFYYGAGCATPELKEEILCTLKSVFKSNEIQVWSDIEGAGRALFGEGEGVAAILGTGSATAFVSDGVIKDSIPSLGYILGDEGSGYALGKSLLNSIFKKQLSDKIVSEFQKEYKLDIYSLINNVYRSPKPAAYIASFTPFLLKFLEEEQIHSLVAKEFEIFFIKNILPYGELKIQNIGMVGSVAYCFRDLICGTAMNLGIRINKILQTPLTSLETFYIDK